MFESILAENLSFLSEMSVKLIGGIVMGGIWIIFIAFTLLSWLVSSQLKARFKRYSQIPTANGMTGREVVEQMLRDHGVRGVRIGSVDGQLSDHYNPENKTINLSKDVYHGRSIAAAAVAAHETGHAIQHAEAYAWLQMRSALVPIVSFSSNWIQWLLLAGIVMVNAFPQLLLTGIVLFAGTTLFSIITLPVEVDASRRALVWLKTSGITTYETQKSAFDALKWAAYTYFIAALSSLATLLYYVMIYMGRRN
ncbi:zinc metallopeptidase [Labilibaculum manganireducens]|uniref:zinc metallopeptidase n=1 Tax=Labilibaculum manganireducens TaxID=1940525 RepID=UPI0029F48406|nr:zinc metallopeptidase [Labilibaculum manganireducens]